MLDGNACLCTNTINDTELMLTECDRPCAENRNEFCGGEYAQSYYDIRGVGPPKNIKITNRTDTSIRITWSAPEPIHSLTRYIIRAIVVKTFGSNDLPSLPEWTVENTNEDIEYELFNLNSGRNHIIFFEFMIRTYLSSYSYLMCGENNSHLVVPLRDGK